MMNRKMAILVSMGFELFGIVLVGVIVGGWLDEKYGWNRMGTLGLILLGFVGWFTHLIVALRALEKDEESGNTTPQ
jgi:F0F1-type ATP synthase assembly protein I